ncbi:hypothetical protein EV581_1198 [Bacillus sp. BK006]|nr:hypothetical protein EV581_1198 [Bacillus sp. BK006]
MDKEEQLRIVLVTFVISVICIAILELINVQILSLNWIKSSFSIFTILTIWWFFYFNYGWKWPLLRLILRRENINGTWFGTYESKSLNNNKIYKGEISLVIKQNYLNIDITSLTERYTSYSYSEVLTHKKKSEKNELVYVYSQKELSPSDHNIRKGTSELELTISKEKSTLYGKFWTNSGTVGHLEVKKIGNNFIEFFEDAKIKASEGESK